MIDEIARTLICIPSIGQELQKLKKLPWKRQHFGDSSSCMWAAFSE